MSYRQDRIDAAIAACTECGGFDFPKRSDCDGCTNAVDEEIAALKIVTSFDYQPIPDRSMDWSAVTDNYDGAPDTHPPCPIGRGATEAEAIADLLEQIEERKS